MFCDGCVFDKQKGNSMVKLDEFMCDFDYDNNVAGNNRWRCA